MTITRATLLLCDYHAVRRLARSLGVAEQGSFLRLCDAVARALAAGRDALAEAGDAQ